MHIQLPEQMLGFIQQQVHNGLYANGAEVVRDALRRLMREAEISAVNRRQEFTSAAQKGIEQIEHGETVPWNPETRARIRENGIQKAANHEPLNPHVCP